MKLDTPVKRIAFDAILLAILCALGCLSLPLGENIKVSLQLLVIFVIGLLNPYLVDSLIISFSYLLIGLFLPIYAGFNAGITPTFGFVVGFVIALPVMKLVGMAKKMPEILNMVLQCLAATIVVYIAGALFMYLYLNGKGIDYSVVKVLMVAIVPYLPFDAGKIVIAVIVSKALRKALGIQYR